MSNDKKPTSKSLKSIIKRAPSDANDPRKISGENPRGTHFQLAVPSFFGGAGKKHSGNSPRHGASLNSIHSEDNNPRASQKVRFLDRLSVRSISALQIAPSYSDSSLDFMSEGDRLRQLQLQDIQDDPSYLPGFVDLYYSAEITIVESTCCCSIHTSYQIQDSSSSKTIYVLEKEDDGALSACLKFCCFQNYDLMRLGFTIRVFNTAVNSTKLLTFRRKTHWLADQLDIVETYYSIENAHVGRIEKTKDGFRLIDARGSETFRILRESKREEEFTKFLGTLIVFSCITRKVVAKITYFKRKFWGRFCSMFASSLKHTIRWSPEIPVASKSLLLGVLLLEIHSVEEYVDLPLGHDANTTTNTTKQRLNRSSQNFF